LPDEAGPELAVNPPLRRRRDQPERGRAVKVVYINTLFHPVELGGAERSLRNLIGALVRHHDIRPVVITLNDQSEQDDLVDQVDGFKVHRLGYRNTRFIFGPRPGLASRVMWHVNDFDNKRFDAAIHRVLDEEQPDLVHTNNLLGFSARPIQLARERGLPVVHTLRDYYLQCWKSCKFSGGQNCRSQCLVCTVSSHRKRHYASQASCVVGNSAYILADHRDNGVFAGVPRSAVVYNIYEPEQAGAPRQRDAAMPIRLGFMGRLNKEKGICELVDQVKGVEGFALVVAGVGDQAAYVEAAAAACDNITYLGFAEPKALIGAVDILVVPSLWHEPLSRTIYEAYAHGVPVIGSRSGGTPEIIEPDVTGAVFDPEHFDEVLRCAARICQTPGLYEAMSAHCLRYATRFTRREIAAAYFGVYTDVLGASRPGGVAAS
jgi:glycosyltransferase involved in cell wall biosynthesis